MDSCFEVSSQQGSLPYIFLLIRPVYVYWMCMWWLKDVYFLLTITLILNCYIIISISPLFSGDVPAIIFRNVESILLICEGSFVKINCRTLSYGCADVNILSYFMYIESPVLLWLWQVNYRSDVGEWSTLTFNDVIST